MQVLVTVDNQGGSAESNVAVKATMTGPGFSAPQTFTASIANLPLHGNRTAAVTGWQIPDGAMTKSVTLTVMVGPVPNEKNLSNNHATFTIVPVLK
jgi:hypothetical protein